MSEIVTIFKPYPFEVGQKINIAGGGRKGDWLVVGVTDNKVNLKCPISGAEVSWARFCYFCEEKEQQWPNLD